MIRKYIGYALSFALGGVVTYFSLHYLGYVDTTATNTLRSTIAGKFK